jgi:hypothetical protein
VELDGPYVTISLKGRFWHKRSTVLARLANYLKQRIPVSFSSLVLLSFIIFHLKCKRKTSRLQFTNKTCSVFMFLFQEILEVEIENEQQLDDSPANF